jgi:hypothetical protein
MIDLYLKTKMLLDFHLLKQRPKAVSAFDFIARNIYS